MKATHVLLACMMAYPCAYLMIERTLSDPIIFLFELVVVVHEQ